MPARVTKRSIIGRRALHGGKAGREVADRGPSNILASKAVKDDIAIAIAAALASG